MKPRIAKSPGLTINSPHCRHPEDPAPSFAELTRTPRRPQMFDDGDSVATPSGYANCRLDQPTAGPPISDTVGIEVRVLTQELVGWRRTLECDDGHLDNRRLLTAVTGWRIEYPHDYSPRCLRQGRSTITGSGMSTAPHMQLRNINVAQQWARCITQSAHLSDDCRRPPSGGRSPGAGSQLAGQSEP